MTETAAVILAAAASAVGFVAAAPLAAAVAEAAEVGSDPEACIFFLFSQAFLLSLLYCCLLALLCLPWENCPMLLQSAAKQYRHEIVRSIEKTFCKNTKQIQLKSLLVCFRLLLYFLAFFRNSHWAWVMKCKGSFLGADSAPSITKLNVTLNVVFDRFFSNTKCKSSNLSDGSFLEVGKGEGPLHAEPGPGGHPSLS